MFFVQINHTGKGFLFLIFREIKLRKYSSLHKIFYGLEELENTYNLLQDISKALINKNVSDLRKLLNCKDTIGYQMNITLKIFKRCLYDLLNAARFTESNGALKVLTAK